MAPAQTEKFSIRLAHQGDVGVLSPWAGAAYIAEALDEQNNGKRLIFLAFVEGELAGYAHLNFFPQYVPFNRLKIPEIQDLFVLPVFRRQGIARDLIMECEDAAKSRGMGEIGLGVGVGASFGAAQRLYTRMGYMPDGAGVVFERDVVTEGAMKPVDNRLCLMLIKSLV